LPFFSVKFHVIHLFVNKFFSFECQIFSSEKNSAVRGEKSNLEFLRFTRCSISLITISLTHVDTHTRTFPLSPSLSHTHTHIHTFTHTHTLCYTHTHKHTRSLSPSLTYTRTHALTRTYTHTCRHAFSHFRTIALWNSVGGPTTIFFSSLSSTSKNKQNFNLINFLRLAHHFDMHYYAYFIKKKQW